LLKTLCFTPQKPECRARERNEAEIAHWLACDGHASKKSEPPQRGDRFLGRNRLFDASHRRADLGAAG
jgi:hypothetical protein